MSVRERWAHPVILAAGFAVAFAMPASAEAQVVDRGNIVIAASTTPEQIPSGSRTSYAITIKNESTVTAKGVAVTIQLPAGSKYVKCTTSTSGLVCGNPSATVVTTTFPQIKAHIIAKVTVTAYAPQVSAMTGLPLTVHAHVDQAIGGEEPRDGDLTKNFTYLADRAPVVFLPSLRQGSIRCGDTVAPSAFQGSETTMQLTASLGCATQKAGIIMAAGGKTLDLNKNKIVGAAFEFVKGGVGVRIAPDVDNVTIAGGGTKGTNGIEYFDYCLMDGGGNSNLRVENLRCFRGRSAGIDIASDNVELAGLLIDRVVGGNASTTTEVPGGVGIHASGKVHISKSIIRRAATIGVWGDGLPDPGGSSRGIQMDGGLETSRIEASAGVGLRLDGPGHTVKDTFVGGDGLGGTSTDAFRINGADVVVDGADIADFAGNGIVGAGDGIQILRTNVEGVAGDAFVIAGDGAKLASNTAAKGTRGFVVTGALAFLDTNMADQVGGDSFIIEGPGANLSNNSASKGLRGYVVTGDDAVLNTNIVDNPGGNGFEVSSNRAIVKSNRVSKGTQGGFVLNGNKAKVSTNRAESNAKDGFAIGGNSGLFDNNVSKKQSALNATGFNVSGTRNRFSSNSAASNKGFEWVIAAGNVDLGSNRANGATVSLCGRDALGRSIPWPCTTTGSPSALETP